MTVNLVLCGWSGRLHILRVLSKAVASEKNKDAEYCVLEPQVHHVIVVCRETYVGESEDAGSGSTSQESARLEMLESGVPKGESS